VTPVSAGVTSFPQHRLGVRSRRRLLRPSLGALGVLLGADDLPLDALVLTSVSLFESNSLILVYIGQRILDMPRLY
jgi:hypothetical protein